MILFLIQVLVVSSHNSLSMIIKEKPKQGSTKPGLKQACSITCKSSEILDDENCTCKTPGYRCDYTEEERKVMKIAMVVFEWCCEHEQKLCHKECKDTKEYRGLIGSTCSQWLGSNCLSPGWQLNVEDQNLLKTHCPESCQLCPHQKIKPVKDIVCIDNNKFKDTKSLTCEKWKRYNCNMASSYWSYTKEQQDDIIKNCPLSCDICQENDDENMTIENPSECRFPFVFNGKILHNCMDTININPQNGQNYQQEVQNKKDIEQRAWCPTKLKNDIEYITDLPFIKCDTTIIKKGDYSFCEKDEDCKSEICKQHSDTQKRCQPVHNEKICINKDFEIMCPLKNICNKNGSSSLFLARYLKKNIKNTPYHTITDQYLSCISTNKIMHISENATSTRNICIGLDHTIECPIDQYCNYEKSKCFESKDSIFIIIFLILGGLVTILSLFLCIRWYCKYKKINDKKSRGSSQLSFDFNKNTEKVSLKNNIGFFPVKSNDRNGSTLATVEEEDECASIASKI